MNNASQNTYLAFRSLVVKIVKEDSFFKSEENYSSIERMLQQPEFNFLLKHINGFIAIFNYKSGFYDYFSEGIKSHLGFEPDQLLGKSGVQMVFSIMLQEHAQCFVNKIMTEVLQYLSMH